MLNLLKLNIAFDFLETNDLFEELTIGKLDDYSIIKVNDITIQANGLYKLKKNGMLYHDSTELHDNVKKFSLIMDKILILTFKNEVYSIENDLLIFVADNVLDLYRNIIYKKNAVIIADVEIETINLDHPIVKIFESNSKYSSKIYAVDQNSNLLTYDSIYDKEHLVMDYGKIQLLNFSMDITNVIELNGNSVYISDDRSIFMFRSTESINYQTVHVETKKVVINSSVKELEFDQSCFIKRTRNQYWLESSYSDSDSESESDYDTEERFFWFDEDEYSKLTVLTTDGNLYKVNSVDYKLIELPDRVRSFTLLEAAVWEFCVLENNDIYINSTCRKNIGVLRLGSKLIKYEISKQGQIYLLLENKQVYLITINYNSKPPLIESLNDLNDLSKCGYKEICKHKDTIYLLTDSGDLLLDVNRKTRIREDKLQKIKTETTDTLYKLKSTKIHKILDIGIKSKLYFWM